MLATIKIFFLRNLLAFYTGTMFVKLKSSIVLGATVSPFVYVLDGVNAWSLLNRDYIFAVLLAITIDHIIGTIYHGFKARDFTFKKNIIGLTTKLGLCVMNGVLFELLNGMTVNHKWLYDYLMLVTRLIVFLYPAGSAMVNSSKLTNGVFPPVGIMDWIKDFQKNLNIKQLKEKADGQTDSAENPSPSSDS